MYLNDHSTTITRVKTWRQPKCPSRDDWFKTVVYVRHIHSQTHRYTHTDTHTHTHSLTHSQEYCSAMKKNEVMPFATTWIDLEMITLNEVRQTEEDRYYMPSVICGI